MSSRFAVRLLFGLSTLLLLGLAMANTMPDPAAKRSTLIPEEFENENDDSQSCCEPRPATIEFFNVTLASFFAAWEEQPEPCMDDEPCGPLEDVWVGSCEDALLCIWGEPIPGLMSPLSHCPQPTLGGDLNRTFLCFWTDETFQRTADTTCPDDYRDRFQATRHRIACYEHGNNEVSDGIAETMIGTG